MNVYMCVSRSLCVGSSQDGATPLSLALNSDNPDCRLWAKEEQQLIDAGDRPRSPSKAEADAMLAAELTKLAVEARSSTLPTGKVPTVYLSCAICSYPLKEETSWHIPLCAGSSPASYNPLANDDPLCALNVHSI